MTRDKELLRRGDVREYVRNFERDFNIPWREQLSKGIDALPAAAPAPTPFVPLALPEAIYALSWAKAALADRGVDAPPVDRALAALRLIGGEG